MQPEEEEKLLAEAAPFIRPYTVYTLALRAGLVCREIAGLNVIDVSGDGVSPRGLILLLRGGDARRADRGDRITCITPEVGRTIARYLDWRRSRCPHFRGLPMRMAAGPDGRERCATCGELPDFRDVPLFLSQKKTRISERQLRNEFTSYRNAAGLRPTLHFDSMKAAFMSGSRPRR